MAGKRTVELIPDCLKTAKQEIEHKYLIRFWLGKERNLENYATLKFVLENLQKFVEGLLVSVEQKILDLMKEKDTNVVILGQYGKKVFFDEEAEWLYSDDMSPEDWRQFDKKCNIEYTDALNRKGLE
jgi:hypothetical protein